MTEPHLYAAECGFDGIHLVVDRADRDWQAEGSENIFGILHEEQPFTTDWLRPVFAEVCERVAHPTFLDMGTGSGVYGVWAKKHFPTLNVVAVDRHDRAIQFATANAERNGVELTFKHESYSRGTMPAESCDVIGLYPPYHIYPPAIEWFIPQHAAGRYDGQGSFMEKLMIAGWGRHLAPNGILFFNQFCPGTADGPAFLRYAPELVGGNPSLTWINALEPIDTIEFLDAVQEGRWPEFTQSFARQYPVLYYTVGYLRNDQQGTVTQVEGHNFDLKGRTWQDRIAIHREFSRHAWRHEE